MDNRKNFKLYGSGVFSTVAVRDRRPILWEKHWKRIHANAATLGLELHTYEPDDVLAELMKAIDERALLDGKARLTFYDNRTGDNWPNGDSSGSPTALDILIGERRAMPSEFCISVSPYPVNSRSPLAGVKSCNYLEPILTLEEAKKRGFDEAIRLNERGHVTSACLANVFWQTGSRLFTPALSTGCLAGTTREYVLDNVECEEVEAGIGKIASAEAVFLTSAGIGIVRVAELNGRRLSGHTHPLLDLWPPKTFQYFPSTRLVT